MIDNLKELERLLKLCRKQGITEIVLGAVSVKFGELPERSTSVVAADEDDASDPYANFPEGPLSNEELSFFANGGLPEDNPYRQEQ